MTHPTLETLASLTRTEIVRGDPSIRVTGLADDSRKVVSGDLFFCMPGARVDGGRFAEEAVAKGAVAVVVGRGEVGPRGTPVLCASDCRLALALAIRAMFRDAIGGLTYVGVTGTNGKTTTTHLVAAVLRAGGKKTAIVGTLGTLRDDGTRLPSKNTTPGPLDLIRTIGNLSDEGYQALVMEVSSQAIVQHRASFLPFANAVWTNLSPEHFELHKDLETYRKIKVSYLADCDRSAREEDRAGRYASIVNLADPSCAQFVAPCRGRIYGFTLGRIACTGFPGETVRGEDATSDLSGGHMVIRRGEERFPLALRLGGHFNLENALAAACVGFAHGIDGGAITRGLATVETVPGRMQRVPSDRRRVVIDYAHTSEGMENLLLACRRMVRAGERLFVVFGCGGDRDNTKRPRMGRAAAVHADRCVITNDNPRTEDPERITGHVLEGVPADLRAKCTVEPDRRRAIEMALTEAGPSDLVVIAGKGHEDYQLVGDRVLHFDDFEVAREILERL
jgi:UDP-N-acetylmuramoyl-L-alanyl-D-glutamate--2,6-diaminopimelate ligase